MDVPPELLKPHKRINKSKEYPLSKEAKQAKKIAQNPSLMTPSKEHSFSDEDIPEIHSMANFESKLFSPTIKEERRKMEKKQLMEAKQALLIEEI